MTPLVIGTGPNQEPAESRHDYVALALRDSLPLWEQQFACDSGSPALHTRFFGATRPPLSPQIGPGSAGVDHRLSRFILIPNAGHIRSGTTARRKPAYHRISPTLTESATITIEWLTERFRFRPCPWRFSMSAHSHSGYRHGVRPTPTLLTLLCTWDSSLLGYPARVTARVVFYKRHAGGRQPVPVALITSLQGQTP